MNKKHIIWILIICFISWFLNSIIRIKYIKVKNNTDVCNYLKWEMIKKDVCRVKINETNWLIDCDNPYLDINF